MSSFGNVSNEMVSLTVEYPAMLFLLRVSSMMGECPVKQQNRILERMC